VALRGLWRSRAAFLVCLVALAGLLLAAERIEAVAEHRALILVGVVLVPLLLIVHALARTAPREVYCPTCGHSTFAYAFPHVKPCSHCGTPTCHVRGKPANCIHCRSPMLPADPDEMAMAVLGRGSGDRSTRTYARCPRCGRGEWIRTDLEGAGHAL